MFERKRQGHNHDHDHSTDADGEIDFSCEEAWTVTDDKITVLQRRTQWVKKYLTNTFRVKQTRDPIVVGTSY